MIPVGDSSIKSESCVRNLGVMLDTSMSMDRQVGAVCRSAFAQLSESTIMVFSHQSKTTTIQQGQMLN